MSPISTNQECDWLNFTQVECSLCETLDPARPPQTNVHTWSGTEAATDWSSWGYKREEQTRLKPLHSNTGPEPVRKPGTRTLSQRDLWPDNHAMAPVLWVRPSILVSIWAPVWADGVFLLHRGTGSVTSLDSGRPAQDGSVVLGWRIPTPLLAIRSSALCSYSRPSGLRALPAEQVLHQCPERAPLQLPLLPWRRLVAPDHGCALRARFNSRDDDGCSEGMWRPEWEAAFPGWLQRLFTCSRRREDASASGRAAVPAWVPQAAARARGSTGRPGFGPGASFHRWCEWAA